MKKIGILSKITATFISCNLLFSSNIVLAQDTPKQQFQNALIKTAFQLKNEIDALNNWNKTNPINTKMEKIKSDAYEISSSYNLKSDSFDAESNTSMKVSSDKNRILYTINSSVKDELTSENISIDIFATPSQIDFRYPKVFGDSIYYIDINELENASASAKLYSIIFEILSQNSINFDSLKITNLLKNYTLPFITLLDSSIYSVGENTTITNNNREISVTPITLTIPQEKFNVFTKELTNQIENGLINLFGEKYIHSSFDDLTINSDVDLTVYVNEKGLIISTYIEWPSEIDDSTYFISFSTTGEEYLFNEINVEFGDTNLQSIYLNVVGDVIPNNNSNNLAIELGELDNAIYNPFFNLDYSDNILNETIKFELYSTLDIINIYAEGSLINESSSNSISMPISFTISSIIEENLQLIGNGNFSFQPTDDKSINLIGERIPL